MLRCLAVLVSALTVLAVGCRAARDESLKTVPAEPVEVPFALFPFRENKKWGYMNKDGQVVVPPRFIAAADFSDHVARVETDSEWYFIDERGSRVFTIPKDWESMRPFSEGLAAFWVKGKAGYCDKNGKIVVPPKFDDVREFSEGLAPVNIGFVERQFVPKPPEPGPGGWGFIDRTGRYVVKPTLTSADRFSEGLALVYNDKGRAYIDKTGKTVLQFAPPLSKAGRVVNRASSFSEGVAWILASSFGDPRTAGFIDKSGKFVIEPQFDFAKDFSGGLAVVRLDGREGYIDHTGRVVIEPQFDDAEPFSDGLAAVRLGDAWGFINREGKFVIHPRKKDQRPGLINDVDWYRGGRQRVFYGGLARVHIGGEYLLLRDQRSHWTGGAWYYVNRQGEIVRRVRLDSEQGPGSGHGTR